MRAFRMIAVDKWVSPRIYLHLDVDHFIFIKSIHGVREHDDHLPLRPARARFRQMTLANKGHKEQSAHIRSTRSHSAAELSLI